MSGGTPSSREAFKDAFEIARELNACPLATVDFILARVSETVAQRQKHNAAAISRLQLPDCVDSWFSEDYRHLRYTNWIVVMPVIDRMLASMARDLVLRLLKINGVAARLEHPALVESLENWLKVLGKDPFVTFICNGVAARLCHRQQSASLWPQATTESS